MLWPSASTVAVDGLRLNVIPFRFIVDDAVRPLYVAVTVAVVSLLELPAVYVTAIVLAELAAEVGDTEPRPLTATAALAEAIAVPPVV